MVGSEARRRVTASFPALWPWLLQSKLFAVTFSCKLKLNVLTNFLANFYCHLEFFKSLQNKSLQNYDKMHCYNKTKVQFKCSSFVVLNSVESKQAI